LWYDATIIEFLRGAKTVFEEIYVSLGQKVYEERVRRNMSQPDLAKLCGVTPSHIGHIERAERVASLPMVLTLLQVLQLTPNDLLQATKGSTASHTSSDIPKRRGRRKKQPLPPVS